MSYISTYELEDADTADPIVISNCKTFDSRDCIDRDYDEYNFAVCIMNGKRKPCTKKKCPIFK